MSSKYYKRQDLWKVIVHTNKSDKSYNKDEKAHYLDDLQPEPAFEHAIKLTFITDII